MIVLGFIIAIILLGYLEYKKSCVMGNHEIVRYNGDKVICKKCRAIFNVNRIKK